MKYTIREIQARDNQKVELIIRSCLIEYGGNHEGTAWMDTDLGRFSEIYNTEKKRYWVVEDEKHCVLGGVGIGPLQGVASVCELQKMYFLPEIRGMGIAQQLIEMVLSYASKYYRRCYLETLDNMIEAQHFYERNGFVKIEKGLGKTDHFKCDVRYIKELCK